MSRNWIIALLIAIVTLAVYLPVARHDFQNFDDDEYVTNNPMVQSGLNGTTVAWAFTTYHAANWHPLTWLSHMLDCQLFGLNAGAHHLVNALFHAVNSALVFLLLLRLTRLAAPAAVAALLFAWHPLHVESVAWVAERKDMLSTFFALLSCLAYVRYAQERHRPSYWLALVLFALGLLAKPMLVTLPFCLLLLDYWPLNRLEITRPFHWSLITEKIPFFALVPISCLLTFVAQRSGQAVVPLGMLPMSLRMENTVLAYMKYLAKACWPAGLAVNYPPEPISTAVWVLAGLGLAVISVAVWAVRRRQRCWLMGWLWFLGTLVPVIGLVQVGGAAMADRYFYIPSIGLFAAVAFGVYELVRDKKLYGVLLAVPLAGCLFVTQYQLAFWRNSETLFRHALAVTRNNGAAHLNLGVALTLLGRHEEALAEYRTAIRLNPDHYQVHLPVGESLMKLGRPQEALAEFRLCLELGPTVPMLHNHVGTALAATGDIPGAVREYKEAIRLDPHYPLPHLELAKVYYLQGQDAQAAPELQAAVQTAPADFHTLAAVARYLAANTNAAARDPQGALALALKANELAQERDPLVFDTLGMALASTGDFTNAVICAQNALLFTPKDKQPEYQDYQARLQCYLNRQPWLESYRATNAPAR